MMPSRFYAFVAAMLMSAGAIQAVPVFVEYPGHPATYGDHAFNATWSGGPVSTVLVEFQSDEAILHEDGVGQSQRTARNTLTFVAPSSASTPQDFDNLELTARYGPRLPLLQQLTANGTSLLTYRFPTPVTTGFDLIVTDVDGSDAAQVRAFGPANAAIDMTSWQLAGAGDLSLYKNTGAGFSAVVAPTPTTTFTPGAIQLTAVDATNYNRSYSILRAPISASVERVEIEFTGTQNSPSRDLGGNGSHIYHALSTRPVAADFDADGDVDAMDLTQWQGDFGLDGNSDADNDGDSDGADFLVWQQQLGGNPAIAASGAVPEPTGLAVAAVVALVLASGRSSRSLTPRAPPLRSTARGQGAHIPARGAARRRTHTCLTPDSNSPRPFSSSSSSS